MVLYYTEEYDLNDLELDAYDVTSQDGYDAYGALYTPYDDVKHNVDAYGILNPVLIIEKKKSHLLDVKDGKKRIVAADELALPIPAFIWIEKKYSLSEIPNSVRIYDVNQLNDYFEDDNETKNKIIAKINSGEITL